MKDVQVLLGITDVNFSDRAKSWVPVTLPNAPLPGDTLMIAQNGGEWTLTVVSRVMRESGSDGPAFVIECEGRFRAG